MQKDLKRKNRDQPRNPYPTVDIIIEVGNKIVLIERKNPPYGWALPGGFVEYGESYEEAAIREAKEETGLNVELLCQMHLYSEPIRDPRFHTVSLVFIGKSEGKPKGGDDAKKALLFLPENPPELAFDHGKIVKEYLKFRKWLKEKGTNCKEFASSFS